MIRWMLLRPGAVLGLGLALAACAAPQSQFPEIDSEMSAAEADKQRQVVIQDSIDAAVRIHRVATPLLVAAAPLCGETQRAIVGVSTANAAAFEGEYRGAAASLLKVEDRLVVTGVVPGTPAEAAGFAVGDVMVSIDGDAVPRGSNAVVNWASKLESAAKRDPQGFDVVVERGGAPKVLHVVPVTGCGYGVEVLWTEDINAYADGEKVMVSRGMMRFAQQDDELALVIAHELAHNAMGHADAKVQNSVGGAAGGLVLDILAAAAGVNTGGAFLEMGRAAGAGAYSVEFEQEADYVGLYLLARSGRPVDRAALFWRRMATLDPAAVEVASTHPTSPARFVALEAAAAEIEGKKASGAELLPEMRPDETGEAPKLTRKDE